MSGNDRYIFFFQIFDNHIQDSWSSFCAKNVFYATSCGPQLFQTITIHCFILTNNPISILTSRIMKLISALVFTATIWYSWKTIKNKQAHRPNFSEHFPEYRNSLSYKIYDAFWNTKYVYIYTWIFIYQSKNSSENIQTGYFVKYLKYIDLDLDRIHLNL